MVELPERMYEVMSWNFWLSTSIRFTISPWLYFAREHVLRRNDLWYLGNRVSLRIHHGYYRWTETETRAETQVEVVSQTHALNHGCSEHDHCVNVACALRMSMELECPPLEDSDCRPPENRSPCSASRDRRTGKCHGSTSRSMPWKRENQTISPCWKIDLVYRSPVQHRHTLFPSSSPSFSRCSHKSLPNDRSD